jgi:hypothetical protein
MAIRENWKIFAALFLICAAEIIILPRTAAIFFDGDAFFYFANRIEKFADLKDVLTSADQARQYRPLGVILFSYVFYPLFKLHHAPYSITALIFHVLNTILVFFILKRLLKSNIAVIAGTALWGFNPIAIYVTHSFSFLADFTYGFFYFIGLLGFLLYMDTGKKRYAVLVFLGFLLSLMSKEAAVTLPALLLLITFAYLMTEESWPEKLPRAKRILPALLAIIALYLLFYSSLKVGHLYDPNQRQNYHFAFSVTSLQNKIDYILSALYLPFPDRLIKPDIDFKSDRLVALASPLIFLLIAYLIWPFEHTNKNVRVGILWFLICASPVLFITPSEFMHNLYVPLLGLAVILGYFFRDAEIFAKKVNIIRPEFLYVYAVCLALVSMITNQQIFQETNWRTYYEKVARNTITDMKALHPRVPSDTTLYLLRSSEVQIPWIAYNGKLFNVFYNDKSIHSLFEEKDQALPLKEARDGKVMVLAYTDDHLFDITRDYVGERLDPTSYSLFDEFNHGEISFINERSRLGEVPPDTPNGRPVFLAPVVRDGQLRHCVITIADGRIRFRVPQLTANSKLVFGIAKKFEMGNGAEGRIYFESGDDRELIFSKFLDPSSNPKDRKWFDETIDLSKFQGKSGLLAFECYPGPNADAIADWFGWSRLQLKGVLKAPDLQAKATR